MALKESRGVKTVAHISDLHLGASDDFETVAQALVQRLLFEQIDHVVVTGDITEQGSSKELQRFEEIFAPLIHAGRVTIVPGNHDRVGEDIGQHMMQERVEVQALPGLFLVLVNTTGLHNRSYFSSHGLLTEEQVRDVGLALDSAPADSTRAVLMHHHPLALPLECVQERISDFLGWPHADELPLGGELIETCLGRCDLILHGHRHIPRQTRRVAENGRPLLIANAGSTTHLCSYPVYGISESGFAHLGSHSLEHAPPRAPSPWRALLTAVSTSGAQLF